MKITFDEETNEIKNRIAQALGYTAKIRNKDKVVVDNPETRIQFITRKVKEHLKEVVKGHETEAAIEVARNEAINNVSEITL